MGERANIGLLKRRGLLTGAAALAAAAVAKLGMAGPAEATHGALIPGVNVVPGIDSLALHVATTNSATDTTRLAANGGGANGALLVSNAAGNGVVVGVSGQSTALVANAGNGVGVQAQSTTNFGLSALSQSGVGVFGGSGSLYGVYANSNADTGVFSTAPQKGVWGRTLTGIGVFGQALGAAPSAIGVYGVGAAPGHAGYFEGNVYITGALTVASGAKSAAVDHPDGSLRRMYCQESPEPWFEDFGKAKLASGRATITLDKDFAAVVKNDDYLVFLTEYGDSEGLYVSAQGPSGFQVSEKKGGTSSAAFTYRVVARRKDAVGGRLEKIERPKKREAKELEPGALPEIPKAEPAKPERRDAR